MRRLQVTAIWEGVVPDRDGLVPDRVLTNMADEVMGDLQACLENADLFGDPASPNFRVDVQMMPLSYMGMPVEVDPTVPKDEVQVRESSFLQQQAQAQRMMAEMKLPDGQYHVTVRGEEVVIAPRVKPPFYEAYAGGATQSYIFPPDHPLANIERAYRSGKTPDQIAREMIVHIDDFKGHC